MRSERRLSAFHQPAAVSTSGLLFLLPFLVALLPLFITRDAHAIGEVSGRLGGVVQVQTGEGKSATKEGIAGVPVTIKSKNLLGGPRTVSTNDDGSYQFQSLPPGSYELSIRLEGFSPIEQRGIQVLAGQMASVDVMLQVGNLTETTKIIEKRNPVLNPESAVSNTVLGNEKVTNTPIFRQVQRMSELAPGTGPGTSPSVRGGLSRYTRFLVDGLDTSDVVTGQISSPMNFDAVEQYSLSIGAMDAEYNSLGLVQNMVTRSGGNKFVVDASLTIQPSAFYSRTRYGAQQPQQNGALLYDDRPPPVRDFYSVNANLGGPIVKDRLWFFSSFQFNYNRAMATIPPFPWYGTTSDSDRYKDTYTYLGRIKLTFQATPRTRLALSFNVDRNYISNDLASTTVTDDAERRIGRGGEWLVLLVDHSFTPKLMFQMQAGFTTKRSLFDAMRLDDSGQSDRLTPSRTLRSADQYNGVTYGNFSGGWDNETKYRVQVDPSLLYSTTDRTGSHNVKAGMQMAYMSYDRNTGVAGGQRFTDNLVLQGDRILPCDPNVMDSHAACNQVLEYPDSLPQNGQAGAGFSTKAQAVNIGLFIQDRWTIKRFLTIVPGFRFDSGLLYNYEGTLLGRLFGYGPRLSIIYDLFHDRTTLISAHYGRHNDVGNNLISAQGNPSQISILKRWNNTTKQFVTDNMSGGAGGQQFGTNITPPKLDEVAVGVKREVVAETVVGIDYTYRKYQNLWVNTEINRLWDPAGLRIVGFANGQRQTIYSAETPDDAQRTYHGLDLWIQGKPGNFGVVASYTLAFATGTVNDYFGSYLVNPRLTPLFDGPLSDNYRHTLKGAIDYTFFFGLNVSTRFSYRTGAPQWRQFQSPEDNSFTLYRSPRGSSTGTRQNDPTTWADFKLPDQFLMDLQAMYSIKQFAGHRFDIIVQLFNVVGAGTATSIDQRNGNTFGAIQGRIDNLNGELIFRYRY